MGFSTTEDTAQFRLEIQQRQNQGKDDQGNRE